ncbi:MAG: oligosaccharide flippase family protein [Nitrospirota bacterium]
MTLIRQIKSISRDALVYGIGNAIGSLIALITAPILTRIFVPSDYGAINLVQTVIGLIVMVAGVNLNSGVFFYYFKSEDVTQKRIILSTSFYFFIAFGLIMSIAAWITAPGLEAILLIGKTGVNEYRYAYYIRILSIGIFFTLLDNNFRSILRMNLQPKKYAVLSVLHVLSNISLTILFVVYCHGGIEGALWSGVIARAITCAAGFMMTICHYIGVFSFSTLMLFMSYSLPAFPSVIMNWAISQMNILFLNYNCSTYEVGIYTTAVRIAASFLLFTTAFRLAWDPVALSIMDEKDSKRTYEKVYTFFIVFMGVLGGAIALLSKPILMILTPPSYHKAYAIVAILIYAYLYQGASNILQIGISISGRTKYASYCQLAAFIVNILLNIVLVPRLNIWGAAYAFAGGIFMQSLVYYFFSQRLYPISYRFWQLHGLTFIMFAIIFTEVHIIKEYDLFAAAFTAFLFIIIIALCAWMLGITKRERKTVFDYTYLWLERFGIIKVSKV